MLCFKIFNLILIQLFTQFFLAQTLVRRMKRSFEVEKYALDELSQLGGMFVHYYV